MTQMSVAPQTMPIIAPAQAAAAPGDAVDPASASAGQDGLDFAAVLKAQIGQPAAKDVVEAEILAALPASRAESGEAAPASDLPAAPDLAALLPALAVPAATSTPAAVTGTPAAGDDRALEPALAASMQERFTPAAPAVQPPPVSARPADPPGHGQALLQAAQVMTPAAEGTAPAAAIVQPVQADVRLPVATEPGMPAAAESAASPALAHAAAPLAHASQAGESPAAARIDTPVGSRGWDAEIGQKVVWMVNRMESRAELTLTPPQLGRVEVTISVSGDQTHATFVSASPAAREALEQALPRLREILADAGISLGQASVNAGSTQGGREEAPADHRAAQRGAAAEPAGRPAETQWLRRGNGLIDTFA